MAKSNKADFQNQYKQIGKVFSPFFDCYINFNSMGLHHLYNKWSASQEELELRSGLAFLVPKFLKEKNTPSAFGLRNYNNGFWEKYWSFVFGYEYRN